MKISLRDFNLLTAMAIRIELIIFSELWLPACRCSFDVCSTTWINLKADVPIFDRLLWFVNASP